jgi:hypothetical protein
MSDTLEHRAVGDRIAIRVAEAELEIMLLRERQQAIALCLAKQVRSSQFASPDGGTSILVREISRQFSRRFHRQFRGPGFRPPWQ